MTDSKGFGSCLRLSRFTKGTCTLFELHVPVLPRQAPGTAAEETGKGGNAKEDCPPETTSAVKEKDATRGPAAEKQQKPVEH